MKLGFQRLFTLSGIAALGLAAASSAYATGGFNCKAKTRSGKIIMVGACVPHGIDGLCSGLNVSIDDRSFTIPQSQIASFYIGQLKSTGLIALKAYDKQMNEILVDLVFEHKLNRRSADEYEKASYSRLVLKHQGQTYRLSDVRCSQE